MFPDFIDGDISGILDADFAHFPSQNISHFSWLYTASCGFEEKLIVLGLHFRPQLANAAYEI
jgi:hypothetical protein